METFKRAKEGGADLLFVHHGLFWGRSLRIEGSLYERIKFLVESELVLYACHLPLDQHPECGNNAALARLLGFVEVEPFGLYHGAKIGYKGKLAAPIGLDEAIRRVLPGGGEPAAVYPFGPKEIRSAGCVSGGAAFDSLQAIDEGLDLYVTGESSHSIYHQVMESGLNVIAGGHYATEVWGVKAVSERLAREKGIRSFFLDLPTGL
jgi:dinuclear metal center YbgI/SA1388 family protein